MSVTTIFDEVIYDSAVFDTVKRYSIDIVEKKSVFDGTNNLFDPVVFDTVAGGIITVSDTVSRLLATYRTMPESVSISDSVSRQLGSLRSISEASIAVSAGVITTILTVLRTITGVSITTSDSAATISPTSNRYIFDLGSVFDDIYFSSPPFDIDVKSYVITDSVSRLFASYRTITGVSISISDSISRVFGAI